MSLNPPTGNPYVDIGVAILSQAGRLFGGSRDTDMNQRQRRRFEAAGGNVIGASEGAKRGSPIYEWQGQRIGKKDAKAILRALDRGAIASPVDRLPPMPVPTTAPVIWGAANAPIPFPPRDQIERERARRKQERAARKAKAKAKPPKPKPNQYAELLKRLPYLARLRRYWGPTGILYGAQKAWRKRREIWNEYEKWEANQPINRAQVIRAPGPGVIPRNTSPRYQPAPGPTSRPVIAPAPIPKGPRTRPVVWPSALPSPSPRSLPRSRVVAAPLPAPSQRPNVSPSPAPAPRARPSSWPGPAPGAAPSIPKPKLPAWLTQVVGPALLAGYLGPKPTPRGRIVNLSYPDPLTAFQSDPLPLAHPRTDPDKCKCPKPKKRKASTCRNPVVSRRKRQSNGRTLITTTRWLKCRA